MEAGLILVGVDFSDASAVAVQRAREIARSSGTAVVVLHVTDAERWSWTAERLEWLAALDFSPSEVVVRTGLPWLQLARFADEIRPSMVVVGSHGTGGFHPVAPGSTAMMLLTRVRVPLLVVPPLRLPPRSDPAIPPPGQPAIPDPWRSGATVDSPLKGNPFFTEKNPS